MTDGPLYVIVNIRPRRANAGGLPEQIYDVHPDDSLTDIRERAEALQRDAASYGRPNDTYRVAELRYVTDEESR